MRPLGHMRSLARGVNLPFATRYAAMRLSPFCSNPFIARALASAFRSSIMIGLVRAVAVCATLALGLVSAGAADKAFKRDDLADSAIKLEAQIKSEAGPVAKTSATLRTDADAAFKRFDVRTGFQILRHASANPPAGR